MLSDAVSVARRPLARRMAADVLTIGGNPLLGVYFSGLFRDSGWAVVHRPTGAAGMAFLRDCGAAVVVWEDAPPEGRWREEALALNALPNPPSWIVVGDDEGLVREVAALGGFDALIRPLRESDVIWTVASAWHHWMKRLEERGREAARCSGG